MQGCVSGLPQSWTGALGLSSSVSTSIPMFNPGGVAGKTLVVSDAVIVGSTSKFKLLRGEACKPVKGLVGTDECSCSGGGAVARIGGVWLLV